MDSLDNDIIIHFASYLCSKDLVSLALTCRRFDYAGQHDTGLSLMEDTAHQIISKAKEHEKEALPRMADQSYIELYSELEKLRAPRVFDHLIGTRLFYVNDDKSHIKIVGEGTQSHKYNTAISNHVMRAGRHYATFTKEGEWFVRIGIVRPLLNFYKKRLYSFDPLDEEHFGWRDHGSKIKVNYCSLMVGSRDFHNRGRCYWSNWVHPYKINNWVGREEFENGDEIGMLLDLDADTLCIYKNGRRLGILKDGLTGEFCWTATMWKHDESVRIEKGIVPI